MASIAAFLLSLDSPTGRAALLAPQTHFISRTRIWPSMLQPQPLTEGLHSVKGHGALTRTQPSGENKNKNSGRFVGLFFVHAPCAPRPALINLDPPLSVHPQWTRNSPPVSRRLLDTHSSKEISRRRHLVALSFQPVPPSEVLIPCTLGLALHLKLHLEGNP